jgi:hypothetical protein
MAQYGTAYSGWTPVAHADAASALANASYHAVRTAATSTLRITEVFIGGEATSSTVNRMSLRRISTNASTPGDVAPGPLNPLSAASGSQGYATAGTGPTIASTNHLMNLAFNAFGGVIRVVPSPGEECWATAAVAPSGQLILDSISGTGLVSTEVVFEEL